MNQRGWRDACDGVRDAIDLPEIEREVIEGLMVEWRGTAADAGDAPAIAQQSFDDRSADP